jgi:hypothetical protein
MAASLLIHPSPIEGDDHAADPRWPTGVDLGANAGSAQGGCHVRADGLRVTGAVRPGDHAAALLHRRGGPALASLLAGHGPEHLARCRQARGGGQSAQAGTGSEGDGWEASPLVSPATVAAWTKSRPWLVWQQSAWRGWSRPSASSAFSCPVGRGQNNARRCLAHFKSSSVRRQPLIASLPHIRRRVPPIRGPAWRWSSAGSTAW